MSASHLCAGGRVFVLTVCMLISLNLLLSYVTVTVVIVNCCRIVYCGECICLSSLALKFSRTVVFTYTHTVHVCVMHVHCLLLLRTFYVSQKQHNMMYFEHWQSM